MFPGEIHQLGQPRHRAVVAHDFADHTDGPAAAQFHQINRRFGVARALQHPAGLGAQGKDMTRLNQFLRHGRRIGHDLDRAGAVGRADAGGDAASGIHAHLEIRFERLPILQHHPLHAQLLKPFGSCGHANQAAAVFGHEIDCLRRRVFRGHDQIAFVLAVGVIHDDHHPAVAQVLDHRFNAIKRFLHGRVSM